MFDLQQVALFGEVVELLRGTVKRLEEVGLLEQILRLYNPGSLPVYALLPGGRLDVTS